MVSKSYQDLIDLLNKLFETKTESWHDNSKIRVAVVRAAFLELAIHGDGYALANKEKESFSSN